MKVKAFQVAVLTGALALATPAAGENLRPGQPSAERGLQLAELVCSGCHLIDVKSQSKVIAGIPSFQAIANRPEQTASRISNVLVQPHRPMPQLQLSRKEIGDLIAYFDALRKPEAGKPLLPARPKAKTKPKYPSPS